MKKKTAAALLADSAEVHRQMADDKQLPEKIKKTADALIALFRKGNKVLLCGNGGSAADAQHIAAELSGKFMMNRAPLFAEALHVNTSYLTATANDYSFQDVYSRLVQAQGRAGDALIAISTSGNSLNVVNALREAKKRKMITIGLTGSKKSKMDGLCDYLIKIPSENTARIQEGHILVGHTVCELVENELFT